jgi:hypothetical protein
MKELRIDKLVISAFNISISEPWMLKGMPQTSPSVNPVIV